MNVYTAADAKCANCGKDFADHNYVENSITDYECPVLQYETSYGYFPGGDPREFHPDYESCSEKEILAHKDACKEWDRKEAAGEEQDILVGGCRHCQPGPAGKKAHFGIGVYQIGYKTLFITGER